MKIKNTPTDNLSTITDEEFEKMLDDFIESEASDSIESEASDSIESEANYKSEDSRQDMLTMMAHLTGLESVKKKLAVYEKIVMFNKLRAESGLPVSATPLHSIFLGSPGTGKTTVAMMMGKMLRHAGLLSSGHVIVRERSTLLGKYYNSEAEKTIEAIEAAQGGILFIDEAYQLCQPDDPRDPGKFVIETLLTALSDPGRQDWMLILAGYPDEMKLLVDMNPGFKSRIPESNVYHFDDFSEDQLVDIAENYLSESRYVLTPDARTYLSMRIKADRQAKSRHFGNARYVRNLIQTEVLPAMAVRIMSHSEPGRCSLTEILAGDIPLISPQTNSSEVRRLGFAI